MPGMNGAIWVSIDQTKNGLTIEVKGGAGATSRRFLSKTGLTFREETYDDTNVFTFTADCAPALVEHAADELIDHIQETLFSADDGNTRVPHWSSKTPNWFSETTGDIHGFAITVPIQ